MDAPQFNGPPGPEHDPNLPAKKVEYRCLDCRWTGKTGEAYAHHRETRHHRIVLRDAQQWGPLKFSCCSELAVPDEPEITPLVKELEKTDANH